MDKISRPTKPPGLDKVANDNGPIVICDLPQVIDIVPGEAELLARYLGDLLREAANDNECASERKEEE